MSMSWTALAIAFNLGFGFYEKFYGGGDTGPYIAAMMVILFVQARDLDRMGK